MAGNKKNHGGAGVGPPHIPAELVEEILTRLPIIDLYAAKCVCTLWRSITTSPEFLAKHRRRSRRNHNPPQLGLLVSTVDTQTRELQFHYARLHDGDITNPSPFVCRRKFSYSEYSGTTQVVNNLVCLYTRDRASLLNICTGEILSLPKPPYHPWSCNHYYLGYDANKVYKILRRTKINTPSDFINPLIYEILLVTVPVSSCKWRKVDSGEWEDDYMPHSVCANGTLYLASSSANYLEAFNLSTENFCMSYSKLSSERKVLQCEYGLGSVDVSLCGKRLNYYARTMRLMWGFATFYLPDELCGDRPAGLLPVGILPDGDTLLAHDSVDDRVTPVYSLNIFGCKRFKRYVVGKFPGSVASMTDTERASRITCIQEDLTPLKVLMERGNDSCSYSSDDFGSCSDTSDDSGSCSYSSDYYD